MKLLLSGRLSITRKPLKTNSWRILATIIVVSLVAFMTYACIGGIYYLRSKSDPCAQFSCD